jgi:cobalt-zinc-cadmium efflux system membrane fusion protein
MKAEGKQAVVLGMMVLALGGCRAREGAPVVETGAGVERDGTRVVFAPGSPQLARIKTQALEMAVVPVGGVTAPGKVEANVNRQARVLLPVTGRVTSVLVKIGDTVKQGQALLTLESADIDAAVSSYQQAQALLGQARSALAKAQMDLDREKDLFAHGAVPRKDVLNAEAVLVQAQAGVEQAQAASEQARRRLEILGVSAKEYGQRVTVHAPIAGKVLEMSVVNGEFRNDLSDAVLTIADLSTVWVTSDVPETAIRQVGLGERVRIELAAYPGEVFHGRVTLIGDTVDAQTRTVKVRAELANPNGRLKPEMFGSIQVSGEAQARPMVPVAAVIAGEGKTMVWREAGAGVFERVEITTGAQVGERLAVLSGLKPDDRVVVDGVMLLAGR